METYWTQLRRRIGPHPNITVPVRTFGGKDNVTTLHESMVENSAWEYIMRDSSGKLTEKKIAQVVTAMLHGVKYTSELGINLFWEARPNIIYDARGGDWVSKPKIAIFASTTFTESTIHELSSTNPE
jgi:hypothetical protein